MAFIRIFGKLLMSLGLGLLLFVAWVLWGTGFYTMQQQDRLEDEFAKQPAVSSDRDRAGLPPKNYVPGPGAPVFRMKVPKLELNDGKGYMVVEGVDEESLKLGPGHYPECRRGIAAPLCTEFPATWPGEKGRVILSGHRTTYLAPFFDIDQLKEGDEVILETKWGIFTYEVYQQRIVEPTDPTVIVQRDNVRELVLTTCNPKYSAAQRLIVYARQVKAEPV